MPEVDRYILDDAAYVDINQGGMTRARQEARELRKQGFKSVSIKRVKDVRKRRGRQFIRVYGYKTKPKKRRRK